MSLALSLSDALSILLLITLGIMGWQWQLQRRDLKDARRLLYRLFEIQTQHTVQNAPSAAPELPPTSSRGSGEEPPVPALTTLPNPATQDTLVPLEAYAARFETLHAALEQTLEQLQKVQQAQETANARLLEVRSLLPEGANVSKIMQRFQKETAAGLERIQVTQTGLVAALDALHATERRDNTLLETLGTELAAQLGEIQADLGLILKARPVRGAGRAQSPYDVTLAAEYYANLQKLIRGMMKNDKASTYALEGVQYLYESLQVQSSLTALLSNAEFAIRLTPRVLDESIVQPILAHLEGDSHTNGSRARTLQQRPPFPATPTAEVPGKRRPGAIEALEVDASEGDASPETELEIPPFLLDGPQFAGASFPHPPYSTDPYSTDQYSTDQYSTDETKSL